MPEKQYRINNHINIQTPSERQDLLRVRGEPAGSGAPTGPPSKTNMLILMKCDLREIENVNYAYDALESLCSADSRAVEASGAARVGHNIRTLCGPLLHCVRGLQTSRPSPPQLRPPTVHPSVSEA